MADLRTSIRVTSSQAVIKPGQFTLDSFDPGVQRVLGAGGTPVLDLGEGLYARPDLANVDRRERIGFVREAAFEAVPVLVEPHGQRPDLVEPHCVHLKLQQRGAHLGLFEELIEEVAPADVEVDLRADVVEHLHAGRQTGLHRVLGQDPLREGVQRAHRGSVQLVQGRLGPLLTEIITSVDALQAAADPVPQFGGSLLGEGDGRDVLHGHPGAEEGHHAVDEGPGLARARSGLHEQSAAQIGADPVAGGLVGELGRGHGPAPSGRACS